MEKHTKGPWRIVGSLIKANHENICVISGGAKGTQEERDIIAADARLIAAAPELLSACETALRYLKAYNVVDHGQPELGKAWGALEDAISKATGEE